MHPKAKTGPLFKRADQGQNFPPLMPSVNGLRASPHGHPLNCPHPVGSSAFSEESFETLNTFFFMNKYLQRVEEDNEEVNTLGIDDEEALSLVLAYQDWIITFYADNSTMSIRLMHDLWLHIKENAPEDFEVLSTYYTSFSSKQIEKLKPEVKNIWKKYRTFEYYYLYSKAFKSAADNFSDKVDEGENPLNRTKLFYLWLVFFHGKEELFVNMGDRRLASKHDPMNLTMESIIGLNLMLTSKSIAPGFENILSLQSGDIIVSQMNCLLEYASPEVREKIWSIISIDSNTLSPAKVADIRENKRRLFVSARNTHYSPYSFCTKTGIANMDAKDFIPKATKVMRKNTPGDWVEHMLVNTYTYLDEHADFCFGKGNDKRPLAEWLLHLGYVKQTENVSSDNSVEAEALKPSDMHQPIEVHNEHDPYQDLSPEESWALEIVHNVAKFKLPMPEGAFNAMDKALKTARKFFGDEQAMISILGNRYVWIELLRVIADNQKNLSRNWRSIPEFKRILKFVQNYTELL